MGKQTAQAKEVYRVTVTEVNGYVELCHLVAPQQQNKTNNKLHDYNKMSRSHRATVAPIPSRLARALGRFQPLCRVRTEAMSIVKFSSCRYLISSFFTFRSVCLTGYGTGDTDIPDPQSLIRPFRTIIIELIESFFLDLL